jgi:hypothetical protein
MATILCSAGGVAQLAERYVRNVEAVGSNPITSTKECPGQRTEGGSSREVMRSKRAAVARGDQKLSPDRRVSRLPSTLVAATQDGDPTASRISA